MNRRLIGFVAAMAAVAGAARAAAAAQAIEVRLNVAEQANVARQGGVVTSGVPFARGVLKDVSRLSVSAGDKAIPAQFTKLASWEDGSVRWALMDCQVDLPAGGKAELAVRDDGRNAPPAAAAKVERKGDAVTLSTGPLEAVIGGKAGGLLQSVKVDGKELVTSAGRGLVVFLEDGKAVAASAPSEVTVEQAGPMRAVVCLRGKFAGVHQELLGYTVRISGFAGQKFVKLHVWLENGGAMGYHGRDDDAAAEWFAFDGMAVELGLGLGGEVSASCEGVEAKGSLRVLQMCRQTSKPAKRGYRPQPPYYTWDDFQYTIVSNAGDKAPATQPAPLKVGARTDGVMTLTGQLATGDSPRRGGAVTAAIRDFWQNYEKAIELDGRTLRLWLWPAEGQWPRPRPNLNSREMYDKTLQTIARDKLYLLAGAVHKGHEAILDFSGRQASAGAAELSSPLAALAAGEYYAATRAAPALFAPVEARTGVAECDAALNSWTEATRSIVDATCGSGLLKCRETSNESSVGYFGDSTHWFGWMDFGDFPVPGRGPVSLHYDWLWILLVNGMRTGDPGYLTLANPLARHRIDVDQLWSGRDAAQWGGLQRGGSNFPSYHTNRLTNVPSVRENWLAGVVMYYMLTGEPKALECCNRNAAGLLAAWEYAVKKQPNDSPEGDMAAHAWTFSSYGAMYDLTGERKWLNESLALFNRGVVAKWKAMGPFLHVGSRQIQSQEYVKDDMKYCYAIQSLCELHERTGDATVLKLLTEGCSSEFPQSFFEAPLFLAGLYGYVGKAAGDKERLARAAELYAEGFPMSKRPPVFLPDNTTWSRASAMMLRSGLLLQWAYWKK